MCTYISHSSVLEDRSPCWLSLSPSVCCPSLRLSLNGVMCFSNVIASFSFGKMRLQSGFILCSPHLTLGWYTQIPLPRCLSSKKATSLSPFLLVSSIFAVSFSNTAPLFYHLLGEKSQCLFNQDHIPTWRTCPDGVCSWHQPCGSWCSAIFFSPAMTELLRNRGTCSRKSRIMSSESSCESISSSFQVTPAFKVTIEWRDFNERMLRLYLMWYII